MNIGENIKNLRNERGFTQKEIAQKLNIAERVYQRYENNEAKPNINIIIKLAKLYNISADVILGIK